MITFFFTFFKTVSLFPSTFIVIQGFFFFFNLLGWSGESTYPYGLVDLNIFDVFQPRAHIIVFQDAHLCPVEIFSCLFCSHFDMNPEHHENFLTFFYERCSGLILYMCTFPDPELKSAVFSEFWLLLAKNNIQRPQSQL